ncbi:MAG: Transcriptional regulator [Cyanobacteria bacterium RYN_339]|nr:Transcriptional regulator [Cyanobacteria bacterium RYN_339]
MSLNAIPNTVTMFGGLAPADQRELDALSRRRRVTAGTMFYRPGEAMGHIYFIEAGSVKVGFLSAAGREITVDYLGRGELFGAVGLGPDSGGQLFARAWEDVVVREMSRRDYEAFILRRPPLVCEINRLLDARLAKVQRRLQQLLFLDMRERIVAVLADLIPGYGEPVEGGVRLRLRLTHQDIANMIGATREATSQVLGLLRRAGAIAFDQKHPVLLTPGQPAPIEADADAWRAPATVLVTTRSVESAEV